MTTEEKKIDIIGKIVSLENDELIDRVGSSVKRGCGWDTVQKARLGKTDDREHL